MSEAYGKICFFYRRWFKTKKVEDPPEDVKQLFKEFSKNKIMTEELLFKFLMECQGETEAEAQQSAKTIINDKKHRKGFNLKSFFHYLLGELNHPRTPQEHDMEAPLTHYFWHAGHDSHLYLNWYEAIQKGEQLLNLMLIPPLAGSDHGEVEMYKARKTGTGHTSTSILKSIQKALERGVRVVELDLWARPDKCDVVVRHEGITSSSLSLKKCLGAIKENAFVSSLYPVIIILVFHDLQDNHRTVVASRIAKTFRNLWCSPGTEFNSLEELKGRIIILTRMQEELPTNKNDTLQKEEEAYMKLIPVHILEAEEGGEPELVIDDPNRDPLLGSTENHPENVSSITGKQIASFTQKNLLAAYLNPKGTGIFSSSYDPLIGWTRGAQMVACKMESLELNKLQDLEKHLEKYIEKYLWIMQGMFRANGEHGYVKKPDILLKENTNFDPTAWRPVKKILKVKVYMGTGWHLDFDSEEFDTTSPPDFFTAIEIVGVPEDEAREKTLPAMDQWIPEWNQEFEFPLTVPKMAFLMIKVSEFDPDRSHDFGGQTCLPVLALRSGIRSIPLYDKKGKPYRSVKLLVRFQLN